MSSISSSIFHASLKVLTVAACPFPWPRGTPIRIQRLAEALTDRGHSVDVATYHLGKPLDKSPFKVHRTAKVGYYKKVSPGPSMTKLFVLDPILINLLLHITKSKKYDIIHAHNIEGLLCAEAARAMGLKLPIVYDAHTLAGSELPDYGPHISSGIKSYLGDLLDHWLPQGADSVIAVTDTIQNALIAKRTKSKNQVFMIPNGIENDFILRAEKARLGFTGTTNNRRTREVKRTQPIYLFAGNMAPYQGIETMLHCFSLVLKTTPQAQLRILTDEPFTQYQALADSLNITNNLSVNQVELDQLPEALVQADVLLNPRMTCAGIPQKLLNYMACGRPVVSFQGSAKILKHRVNALVVENDNIQGFSNAMTELATNQKLSNSLSKAALSLIMENFSWANSAQQTEEAYQHTLSRYSKN